MWYTRATRMRSTNRSYPDVSSSKPFQNDKIYVSFFFVIRLAVKLQPKKRFKRFNDRTEFLFMTMERIYITYVYIYYNIPVVYFVSFVFVF